jgi:RNA-directed DNA polymerase
MQPGFTSTTIVIADAMLAAEPFHDAVIERMTAALGIRAPWMADVAADALLRFGERWEDAAPAELADLVAGDVGFIAAWKSEQRPVVVRIVKREPRQKAPPPRLAHAELPSIATLADLANWLELRPGDLEWLANRWRVDAHEANSRLHHYSYHACEKRDGRHRLIERPKALLRVAQHKLLHDLIARVSPHEAAHGFRRGRSIVSFAAPHANRAIVIRFDLADFFASVTEARVHALFRTLGYPQAVTRAMSALVTNRVPSALFRNGELAGKFDWTERQRLRDRHLPQGASTSPALANLCAFRLDMRLAALAKSLGATYTRYADDLAFSGGQRLSTRVDSFGVQVAAIALEEGFSVQTRKTRIMRSGTRQRLAGVVINRHPNLSRERFDTLKAMLTNCVRHGPASQNRDGRADFRASLEGHVAHACMLNRARGEKLRRILEGIEWG